MTAIKLLIFSNLLLKPQVHCQTDPVGYIRQNTNLLNTKRSLSMTYLDKAVSQIIVKYLEVNTKKGSNIRRQCGTNLNKFLIDGSIFSRLFLKYVWKKNVINSGKIDLQIITVSGLFAAFKLEFQEFDLSFVVSDGKYWRCHYTCNSFCFHILNWNWRVHPELRLNISLQNFLISTQECYFGNLHIAEQTAPNKSFIFCGSHSQFSLYSSKNKLSITLKTQIRISYDMSFKYSLIEKDFIQTKVYETVLRIMFYLPLANTFFESLLIQVSKFQHIVMNITQCEDECWIFDGPAHGLPLVETTDHREIFKTSTFQCLLYVSSQKGNTNVSVHFGPDRSPTFKLFQLENEYSNKPQTFTFPSNTSLNCVVVDIFAKSGHQVNLSISHIHYEDRTKSQTCNYGGMTLYDGFSQTDRITICKAFTAYSWLKSFYSETSNFTIVFYHYEGYSSLNVSLTLSLSKCSAVVIDVCVLERCDGKLDEVISESEAQNLHIDITDRGDRFFTISTTDFNKCVSIQLKQHKHRLHQRKHETHNCHISFKPKPLLETRKLIMLDIVGFLADEALYCGRTAEVKFEGRPDSIHYRELKKDNSVNKTDILHSEGSGRFLRWRLPKRGRSSTQPGNKNLLFKATLRSTGGRTTSPSNDPKVSIYFPQWMTDNWVDFTFNWNISGNNDTEVLSQPIVLSISNDLFPKLPPTNRYSLALTFDEAQNSKHLDITLLVNFSVELPIETFVDTKMPKTETIEYKLQMSLTQNINYISTHGFPFKVSISLAKAVLKQFCTDIRQQDISLTMAWILDTREAVATVQNDVNSIIFRVKLSYGYQSFKITPSLFQYYSEETASQKSWHLANSWCRAKGRHLPIFHSKQDEATFLLAYKEHYLQRAPRFVYRLYIGMKYTKHKMVNWWFHLIPFQPI